MEEGRFFLEGYAGFAGIRDLSGIRVFLQADTREIFPCEILDVDTDRVEGARWLGELVFPALTFRCEAKNLWQREKWSFRLYTEYRGVMVERKLLLLGWLFPMEETFRNSYARVGQWIVQKVGNRLLLSRQSFWGNAWKEGKLLLEIARKGGPGKWEGVCFRLLYHTMKPLCPKNIWLISDRINKADDNGEALFRYLKETGKPEHAYFVLRRDSVDYGRVSRYGTVLGYGSLRHKLMHLLAGRICSSAADEFVYNPFGEGQRYYWDILRQQPRVFLQHGIIKDDLSGWLNCYKKNLSLFVTSTVSEYHSVLGRKYWYGDDVVKLTGLPRYDRLESRERNTVLVMPTWRKYLADGSTYARDGISRYGENFTETKYFRFYDALLNHPRLLDAAKSRGYRILFVPHPNLMSALSLFRRNSCVEFASLHTRYSDVFSRCALAVTDYSSAVFDAAYLYRPIVYCQFDRKEFFAGHVYREGYFDYERDGFGEVEHELDGTVRRMIEYMDRNCELKERYRRRIDCFFAFHDRRNCQRVYEAIRLMGD